MQDFKMEITPISPVMVKLTQKTAIAIEKTKLFFWIVMYPNGIFETIHEDYIYRISPTEFSQEVMPKNYKK